MDDKVREKFLALEESLFKAWNDYLALKEIYKETYEVSEPRIEESTKSTITTTPLTEEQADIIRDDLEEMEDITASLLKYYNVKSINDLPSEEFKAIRINLKRIKKSCSENLS